jgi:ferritin
MKTEVQDGINRQINQELFAGYLYLGMSAHFEAASLEGFAGWMRHQAEEELAHAMRLFDHMNERGGRVVLDSLEAPPNEFGSPLEIFRQALAGEQKVTGLIHSLYELAVKHSDYPTQVMLHWFITEQVEEEDATGTIVDQLEMIGDDRAALLMLDRQLGERSSE